MLVNRKIKSIARKIKTFEFKITAFIAVAVIIIFTIGFIAYSSLRDIVNGVTESIHRDGKVLVLKDVLTEITEAENQVKSFTFTNDTRYLEAYKQSSMATEKKLAELKKLSEKDSSRNIVDSLSLLVHIKYNVLKNLIELRDTGRVANLLSHLSEKISPGKPLTNEKPTDKTDLFSRLLSRLQKKTKTTNEYGINSFKDLQQEIDRLMYLEAENTESSFKAQMELVEKDKVVMAGIRDIFQRLEAAERRKLALKTAEAELIASRTNLNITLFLLALAALLCTLGYFILSNIKKRREYELQLQRAKVETEQLAGAKELFLANMSHEIRTPLHAITGFSEQLMTTGVSKDQRELLEIIKRSGDHLLKLVNNVLDLSKIHAGKLVAINEELNVNTLIADAVNVVRPMADKKDLKLWVRTDTGIPERLYGDAVKLTQVLINILSNAVKFTQKGSVELSASMAEMTEETLTLEIVIKDTGIGISEELLETIFDEFVQANNSESIRHGGTGLGLTISRKLCLFMGGSLTLDSKKDQGTSVVIKLPFNKTGAGAVSIVSENQITERLAGKKVLIADDEPYNLKLLGILLQKWGLNYKSVTNGRAVLEQLKKEDFDALLIDLSMPEMDGIETTQQIRKGNVVTDLPIVVLTAGSDPEIGAKCKAAGIDFVLTKPFLEADLQKLLQGVFSGKKPPLSVISLRGEEIPAGPKDEKQLYHLEELKTMAGGDRSFVRDMIETFIQSSSKNLGEMQDALDAQNNVRVGELAHSMAPSCRHLGMSTTVEILKRIEEIAADTGSDSDEELNNLYHRLYELFQKVLPLMSRDAAAE